MTHDDIAAMLAGIGLPTAYDQFRKEEAPGAPPFICFLYPDSADFIADDTIYQRITELSVELYTDAPDFALEAAVEAALNGAGLVFSRSGPDYIESERMYQTTYDTSVVLTEPPPEPPEPPEPSLPQVPDPSDPSTLYNGQTVRDGYVVNQSGISGIVCLEIDDAEQYQGVSFIVSCTANSRVREKTIRYFVDSGGQYPVGLESIAMLDPADYRYEDGVYYVNTQITIPDNAIMRCTISFDTYGVKDIVLTEVTPEG